MPTRIAIHGVAGRMGRRILALGAADPEVRIVCAVEQAGDGWIGRGLSELEPGVESPLAISSHLMGEIDVVIDFSAPEATMNLLNAAAQMDLPVVVGTTGLSDEQAERVHKASAIIPILRAPNMSLGVNLLFRVAAEVAKSLSPDYEIEIVEAHHDQKADAPSGTAMGLAEAICAARQLPLDGTLVHGRSGRPGPRTPGEIGMHALRMGSVVGDHTVHFANPHERIELTHRAQSRDVFAAGALCAARWLVGRKPRLYSMQDVLFGGGAV